MELAQQMEQIFSNAGWEIAHGESDEPLQGFVEHYRFSATSDGPVFRSEAHFIAVADVIVHRLRKRDGELFSNLRLHSAEPIQVAEYVIAQHARLEPEGYNAFVRALYDRCDKVLFNDHGLLVRLTFGDPG